MHGQTNTAKQVRNGTKQAPARGASSVQRQVARKQEECAIPALNTEGRKMAASGVLRRCRRCAQAGRGDSVSCRSTSRTAYVHASPLLDLRQTKTPLVPPNGNDQGSKKVPLARNVAQKLPGSVHMLQTYHAENATSKC